MQVTYIPYLPLKEDNIVDFKNGVVFWHFKSLAEKYIPDESLRNLIQKLLEANVQGEAQEKIKSIAVVSIVDTDFRVFNREEENALQESKLILFLSRIAKNNTTILGSGADGWSLSTSENFEPVFQNFEIGNDHIAERAGYIINVGIGGYKINEKKFYKPSHVSISPYGLSIDRELFTSLIHLRDKNGKRLYRRILRATELLFQAYYNSSNVSRNARILLIAAAFETLLDLPESQGRKHFKDLVEKYCDIKGESKYRHFYFSHGKKKRDNDRSIKVLWADSFFHLRNQIIHGDIVKDEMYFFQDGDRHIDISILFYCLLVKELINEKISPKPFQDFIKWQKRKDGTTGFNYEDNEAALALSRMLTAEFKRLQKKK